MIIIKKTYKLLLIAYFISWFSASAQDPQFSQFYAAPLYLAPSFAGTSSQKTRVALNYRNQWPEIPHAFTTYAFSFDHYVSQIKSGIGLIILRDEAGMGNLATTTMGGMYSFDIQVNPILHVRPGAHFYYTFKSLNFNELNFYDELRSGTESSVFVYPTNTNNKGDVDFTLSALAYTDLYWLGLTADHLLSPDFGFYGEKAVTPVKYSLFGGAKLIIRERLLIRNQEDVSFAFLYKRQGRFQQLDLGTYYFKNPMIFGVWYRGIPLVKSNYPGSDALVFLVGYRIENVSIGYSYDFTISKLRNLSGGSHEVSLIWSFKIKKFRKKPAALPCPEF